MTIFVSIASYRDSQLGPTVQDCLAKADRPGDLRFGICWQHAPDEAWPLDDHPRFRVIDVDYRSSRGACWARSQIAPLMAGEDWYLQLDSHHRFAPGWDTALIAMAEAAPSPRPLITTYPTGFTLPGEQRRNPQPWRITFGRWSPDGIPLFFPAPITAWKELDRPLRARFIGACFIFAPAQWAVEVPYDPEIYFNGEEITLAIRSFTTGYDLFHPVRTLVWHEWSRSYRPRHSGDHVPEKGARIPWWKLEQRSVQKIRGFLCRPHVGPFGCGKERTFADYESYSGLDLGRCRVQEYTLANLEPPNPPADPSWSAQPRAWRIMITIMAAKLEPPFLTPNSTWELRCYDPNGEPISTVSLTSQDRAGLRANEDSIAIEHHFDSARTPVMWTLHAGSEPPAGALQIGGTIDGIRRGQPTSHSGYIMNRLA
jgi:hypothetical protein